MEFLESDDRLDLSWLTSTASSLIVIFKVTILDSCELIRRHAEQQKNVWGYLKAVSKAAVFRPAHFLCNQELHVYSYWIGS